MANGVRERVDESRTVVRSNGDVEVQGRRMVVVEISSDEEDDDEEDSEGEQEEGDDDEAGKGAESESESESGNERAAEQSSNKPAGERPLEIQDSEEDDDHAEDVDENEDEIENEDEEMQNLDEDIEESHGNVKHEDTSKMEVDTEPVDQDVAMTDGIAEDKNHEVTTAGPHNSEQPPQHEQDQEDQPSFGDLLRANAPDPIDVEATFTNPTTQSKALTPAQPRTLTAPTATSLGTVLTQALRTNDRELLESCLSLNDLDGVRSTIERLPSPLVSNLLQQLAERLHKRPGRAGALMVWVQWALVSHGGYLAGQPDVMGKLASLNRVIKERADGLQPLLRLKGKLDMLAAQLELRKSMRLARERQAGAEDEDDEEQVIYVEGKDDDDMDEDDEERKESGHIDAKQRPRDTKPAKQISSQRRKSPTRIDIADIGEPESSSDEALPVTVNGVHPSSDAEEDEDAENEDDEDDDEELIDDEAEETENDTGDDISEDDFEESAEELDAEDIADETDLELEDAEDDDELAERRPAAKRSTAARTRLSGFGMG